MEQAAMHVEALENWRRENTLIPSSYTPTIQHLLLPQGDPEMDTVSSAVSHALGLRTLVSNPPPPSTPSFAPFSNNELRDAFTLKATPGARAPRELRLASGRSRGIARGGGGGGGAGLHGRPRPGQSSAASAQHHQHYQQQQQQQQPPPPPNAPPPSLYSSSSTVPNSLDHSVVDAGVRRQEAMMEAVRRMINIKWPKGVVKNTAESYQRAGFPYGNIFAVKLTNSNAVPPGYFEVVKYPMDLDTVKTKVTNFEYSSLEEFAADVRLVYANALLYNKKANDVNNKMALILKNVVETELGKISHLAMRR